MSTSTAHLPLADLTRRAEFFGRCAELALRLRGAADAATAATLLGQAAAVLGAESAFFASFMKDGETDRSYRFVLACDARWCFEYEHGALFRFDPWWTYAQHHSEAAPADEIPTRTQRERAVIELAHRYGFVSALIAPAHSPKNLTRLGMLCLGTAEPAYFRSDAVDAVKYAATALALGLHAWMIEQLRHELLAKVRLGAQDLELLRHEWLGHGSKQTATALGTSSMSVDSRWQRLNAKLGVSTRKAAASLAAEYGVI